MMKYITPFVLLMCTCFNECWAADHLIFRSGKETDVKLYQVTDQTISYALVGDESGTLNEVPSNEVYMVYIEGSGNVYISNDGKRITGEPTRANYKKNDVVYLVKGAEISAESVRISENEITYTIKTPKKVAGVGIGLLHDVSESTIDKAQVFMIRYKNGMRDIITPFEDKAPAKAETEQLYTVVFHAVGQRECLNDIANKYQVTPEKIIEWNELSPKTKYTTPLTKGMQLMIYQPNAK